MFNNNPDRNKNTETIVPIFRYGVIIWILSFIMSFLIFILFSLLPNIILPDWMVVPFLVHGKETIIQNSSNTFFNMAAAVYAKNLAMNFLSIASIVYVYWSFRIVPISTKKLFHALILTILYFFVIYAFFFNSNDHQNAGLTQGNIYRGEYFRGVFMVTFSMPVMGVIYGIALSTCLHMERKRRG